MATTSGFWRAGGELGEAVVAVTRGCRRRAAGGPGEALVAATSGRPRRAGDGGDRSICRRRASGSGECFSRVGRLGPWPRRGLCSVSRRLPSSAASSPMQRPPSILSAANPPVHRMQSSDGDHPCCGHTARAATVLTLAPLPLRRSPFAGSHPPGGGQSAPAARRLSPWRPHPLCGRYNPVAVAVLPSRRSVSLRRAPSAGGHVPSGCHRPRASANPPTCGGDPPRLRRPPTADGQPQGWG